MGTIEKDTLQAVFPHSFFDGETVVDAIEILRDEIKGVGLQKPAHSNNVLVVNPNITGLSVATVAGTPLTGTGVKAEIKSFFLYDLS
ncbi:MAG TPA: hypothetical protein VJ624_03665 [Thermodesulfobacteriota bacterium]|nr:hypothetical protein [Thermodesulfobacteriota bacterium]